MSAVLHAEPVTEQAFQRMEAVAEDTMARIQHEQPQGALESEPLTAEDEGEGCGGDLTVVTFAYPSAEEEAYDPSYRRLAGVPVTITSETAPFTRAKLSDANGEAHFDGIPAGTYNVTADSQDGYQDPSSDTATVDEAGRAEAQIGFAPKTAEICGNVYFYPSADHSTHAPRAIERVKVEAYVGDERVACEVTDGKGAFCLKINTLTGTEIVELRSRRTLRASGQLLTRSGGEPLYAQLAPGEVHEGVIIRYIAQQARIETSAIVTQKIGEREQTTRIPITIQLFRQGAESSGPIAEISTLDTTLGVLTGLVPGNYVLRAPATTTYLGKRLEITRPAGGIFPFILSGGQELELADHFQYRMCAGTVVATVRDPACNAAVAGAPLVLTRADGHGTPIPATTDDHGVATWQDLSPGAYVVSLEQQKFTATDGRAYIMPRGGRAGLVVTVTPGGVARAEDITAEVDVPLLFGVARGPDGKPLSNALLEILDANHVVRYTTTTDGVGNYEQIVDHSGIWKVRAAREPTQVFTAMVQSPGQLDFQLADAGGTGGRPHQAGGELPSNLSESVIDLAAYPILTEDISAGGGPPMAAPPGGGAGGVAPLGQIVERELRTVLGWRVRPEDPKGFQTALAQSFAFEVNDQGQRISRYVQRNYAVTVDAGAITGAQASIYTRARAALDQSMPILDGLYALNPAADPQDVEAIREVVRSQFQELVYELGQQAGPSVQRVDSLFQLLTEIDSNGPGASQSLAGRTGENVGGTLGELRLRFGLDRSRVTTIDEEQDLTNFFIVVDYIISLQQSWVNQRTSFSGITRPFLGTQLVLLTRQLAVVAESVQEVEFAMDSVFLRAGERAAIALEYQSQPNVFLGELLDWVRRFAAEEGPRLIQEAGKIGVFRLFPTVERLGDLVEGALVQYQPNANRLPAGYRTTRVQRALSELAVQLDETANLARPFKTEEAVDVARLAAEAPNRNGVTGGR